MADWIVCPACNLKHSRRSDARCPRCRESVDRAAAEPVTAAPIEPGRPIAAAPAAARAAASPPAPRAATRPQSAPTPRASRPQSATAAGVAGQAGSGWLAAACRTRALRAFSTASGLLAVGLVVAVAHAGYWRDFVGGPYPLSAAELEAISDPSAAPHAFARVEGSETIETGLEQYEVRSRYGRETGRTLKARYWALAVGDGFLLVKSKPDPGTVVQGRLRRIDGELASHLFSMPQMREVRTRFRPYFLDTASFRSPGYWGLGVGGVVFAALLAWAAHAWKRLQSPADHPLLRRAAGWGDPAAVAAEIERQHARPWRKAGAFAITEGYVVKSAFYEMDVVRLTDLLWAYKKVIKKSVNFIPVGKDYQAVLACVGGTMEIQTKEAAVEEILEYAAARAPWAVFGHSAEIQDAFQKDAPGFAAAVAERRRQFEAGQAAEAAS